MRKILVVIDMQNDFIDGSLGTKEAQQIVPRVVEKMKEYDPWNIYLTRDTHYENYLDTQEGRNLPVEHCIEGTHGWQLNDAVAKAAEKATVIDKPTFGSNRLAGILMTERAQEALEIELVGLCTDICVVSNARSAHHRGRELLRRRHAGEPPPRARDDEDVPDQGRQRLKKKGKHPACGTLPFFSSPCACRGRRRWSARACTPSRRRGSRPRSPQTAPAPARRPRK